MELVPLHRRLQSYPPTTPCTCGHSWKVEAAHRCLRCANAHTSEGPSGHSWGEVGWREGPWGVCAGEGLLK